MNKSSTFYRLHAWRAACSFYRIASEVQRFRLTTVDRLRISLLEVVQKSRVEPALKIWTSFHTDKKILLLRELQTLVFLFASCIFS